MIPERECRFGKPEVFRVASERKIENGRRTLTVVLYSTRSETPDFDCPILSHRYTLGLSWRLSRVEEQGRDFLRPVRFVYSGVQDPLFNGRIPRPKFQVDLVMEGFEAITKIYSSHPEFIK